MQTGEWQFPSAVGKLADQAADRVAAATSRAAGPHEFGLQR
jgi:hypothetical protein